MKLVAGVQERDQALLVEDVDLPHRHARVVLLEHGAHAAEDLVAARPVLVLAPGPLPHAGVGSVPSRWATSMRKPSMPRSSQKRSVSSIAASSWGLAQFRSGWWAVNACRYHWPVARVMAPRRPHPLKRGAPRVGGQAPGPAVAPDVPVAPRVVARGPRRLEPGVAVGGVVRDPVDDDPDAARVRLADQPVGVGEAAEQRVHAGVVGHVVAEVGHRRGVEGRQPDRVDPQRGRRAVVEVVQVGDDAGEVADAVAVGVGEAARVDLVDDGLLPPHARA